MTNNTPKDIVFAQERKRMILQLLEKNERISVQELCEYLGVSSSSIRNYLRQMDNEGLLERTHGGALLRPKTSYELNSIQKKINNHEEKTAIAKAAAELIENGDTVVLDTGTTTFELARQLKNKKGITVVVNDIEIARCLEEFEGVNVLLLGGMVRKNFHCTVGTSVINTLSRLNVDKAFIATNALSFEKGLTTPDINQSEVKKAMIGIASAVILLCDCSKIGKESFVQFAELSDISKLITDSNISKYDLDEFKKNHIEVVVAAK